MKGGSGQVESPDPEPTNLRVGGLTCSVGTPVRSRPIADLMRPSLCTDSDSPAGWFLAEVYPALD